MVLKCAAMIITFTDTLCLPLLKLNICNSTTFPRNVHVIQTAKMRTSWEGARQVGAKQIVDVHLVVSHAGNYAQEPAILALKKI